MTKLKPLLFLVWNLLLTAVLGWMLFRSAPTEQVEGVASDQVKDELPVVPSISMDSVALSSARIAYFHMDSVQQRYDLIKEKDDRFKREGQRLENNLQNELARAQARYDELMKKDHSYSTQAELKADEAEVQGLMGKIQQLQARSEEQLMKLEAEMLNEITKELKDFLKAYNAQAGFDYIFSIQNGGQIWVGNEGLNITEDMVQGLNARYRASKQPSAK
ncbi:MAG: OmpH family outer membrane protein [Flavobacteriales bacterium]|jgi:outer membrane protein|nr:OmpH family outer membrane protein [Flavobacteriales bacterium]